MNKIITVIKLASLSALLTLPAFSAEPTSPTSPATASQSEPKGERFEKKTRRERMNELRRLTQELDLTKPQQESLRGILRDRRDAMQDLSDTDRMGEKGKQLRQEYRKKVRDVLTPEQQAKFDAMKQDARERQHRKD